MRDYPVMRVTENSTQEIFWIDGHEEQDAHDALGQDISIEFLWALTEDEVTAAEIVL